MALLLLLLACDGPDDCPGGAAWSPAFGQCVGVEATTPPPPEPTGDTGDSGADTATDG